MIFSSHECDCFIVNNGYITISVCKEHRGQLEPMLSTLKRAVMKIQGDNYHV